MVRTVRKSGVKAVPLSKIKDDLSRYLRQAETQEIIITRHGKPAGVLIGFESEEDWFDYRLEHDPHLLRRYLHQTRCCANLYTIAYKSDRVRYVFCDRQRTH